MDLSSAENKISRLRGRIVDAGSCDNLTRRALYSDVELLRLDIIESGIPDDKREGLYNKLDDLASGLALRPLARNERWWTTIDYTYRFIGLVALFITTGAFFSVPLFVLQSVDSVLIKVNLLSPSNKLSEMLKRFIAKWFVLVSGVTLTVDGLDPSYFQDSCAIMTFSHASNLDGFLISSTCPVQHFALAKKELFLVPFFSWIALAFGGVPVDRKHRERAVLALQRSTEAAKSGNSCIVIAPEGTRSTTGQLNTFKKGVFHMWEQLKSPIVPFITYGAFELFPKKSWVNTTGRVHARYLKPILPSEATSRQQMEILLRRRMLEALKDCPPGLDKEISTSGYIAHVLGVTATLALDVGLGMVVSRTVFKNMSPGAIASRVGIWSGALTAGLYIYYVYLIHMWPFSAREQNKSAKKTD